ncbi:MAG: Glutamyl-tRNA synthetase @ Glutamyl-tRNA(Gln) synthetase, partial [uncultured Rubrobacteraceae bacterium]
EQFRDQGTLRAEPDGLVARRRGQDGALQLALRAQERGDLRPPHRRYGPRALDGGLRRAAQALAPLDRPGLGRGTRGRRSPRPLSPDRTLRPLPRGRGEARRFRCRLPGLRHDRRDGRVPGEGAGREATADLQGRRVPRHGPRGGAAPGRCRGAVHRPLQDAGRGPDRRRGPHPGTGDVRELEPGRLRHHEVDRHPDLQLRGGRRRRRDEDQPRHPRRRPPLEHATTDPDLRVFGLRPPRVRPRPAGPRAGQEEALQAPRGGERRGLRGRGVPSGGALQLPRAPRGGIRGGRGDLLPRRARRTVPHRARERQPGGLRREEADLHKRPLPQAPEPRGARPDHRPDARRIRGREPRGAPARHAAPRPDHGAHQGPREPHERDPRLCRLLLRRRSRLRRGRVREAVRQGVRPRGFPRDRRTPESPPRRGLDGREDRGDHPGPRRGEGQGGTPPHPPRALRRHRPHRERGPLRDPDPPRPRPCPPQAPKGRREAEGARRL